MPAIEYRYTLDLLRQKLIMKIRLSDKLNTNVYHKQKFLEVTEQGITFHLNELSEGYIQANVAPDLEKFSLQFIEFIKPVLKSFLIEIGYGGSSFRAIFRYRAEKFEKVFTILIETENG